MPHTYMRTSLGRRGLNSSFSPVRELCILSMGLEAAARRLRRDELEQGPEFGTVSLAGQRNSQRHEEIRSLAARAFFQNFGQLLQIRRGLVEGGRGGGEKSRPGRRNDALLVLSQGRQLASNHVPPGRGIGGQHHGLAYHFDEICRRVSRTQA